MGIDPAQGFALDPETRAAERIAELERRLSRLENGAPTIQVGAGAPTLAPRDGTPYADASTVRLYLRVGGAWRYTTLT